MGVTLADIARIEWRTNGLFALIISRGKLCKWSLTPFVGEILTKGGFLFDCNGVMDRIVWISCSTNPATCFRSLRTNPFSSLNNLNKIILFTNLKTRL